MIARLAAHLSPPPPLAFRNFIGNFFVHDHACLRVFFILAVVITIIIIIIITLTIVITITAVIIVTMRA